MDELKFKRKEGERIRITFIDDTTKEGTVIKMLEDETMEFKFDDPNMIGHFHIHADEVWMIESLDE